MPFKKMLMSAVLLVPLIIGAPVQLSAEIQQDAGCFGGYCGPQANSNEHLDIADLYKQGVGKVSCSDGSSGSCFFIGNYKVDGKDVGVHVTAGHVTKNTGIRSLQYQAQTFSSPTVYKSIYQKNTIDMAIMLTPTTTTLVGIPMVSNEASDICVGMGYPKGGARAYTKNTYVNKNQWMQTYKGQRFIPGMSGGAVCSREGVIGVISAYNVFGFQSYGMDIDYISQMVDLQPIVAPNPIPDTEPVPKVIIPPSEIIEEEPPFDWFPIIFPSVLLATFLTVLFLFWVVRYGLIFTKPF